MRHEQHRRGEGTHHGGGERERAAARHTCRRRRGSGAARSRRPRGRSSKRTRGRHDACATPLHLAGSLERPQQRAAAAMATPPPVVDIVTAGDASRASLRALDRRGFAAHLLVCASFGTALLRLQRQEANWCVVVATPSWLRRALAF